MARKRKRARKSSSPTAIHDATTQSAAVVSPQASSSTGEAATAAAPSAATCKREPTNFTNNFDPVPPKSQQQALVPSPTIAINSANADDTMQQSRKEGDDSDSDGLPGIPWALPPELDEPEEEDTGVEESDVPDESYPSPSSTIASDPNNRWKQHPDRRRKLAGGGDSGSRLNNRSKGSNEKLDKTPGKKTRRNVGAVRSEHPGGAGAWGGTENGTAFAGQNEAGDDEEVTTCGDGYYGPRVDAPSPCTVFAPCEGKLHRVRNGSSDGTAAPTALVVGLDPQEQLCFVGAALVRCGRGQADVSGYTLLPAAWGPYVEAHSPRWMGLLVVRALAEEEYSEAVNRSGNSSSSRRDSTGAVEEDSAVEDEIEEAIDRIAEDFPVVVVLKSLSGNRPLASLSAQADADALYAQHAGFATQPTAAHDETIPTRDHQVLRTPDTKDGPGEPKEDNLSSTAVSKIPVASKSTEDLRDASRKATTPLAIPVEAELRLPGMQVVVTNVAGLRPLSFSQGWADAVNSILAAPPLPTSAGGSSVLVCGAKGVGKSTFCRLLVNRMLSRHREVAYMDCDLGQPEFTTPGQVSLHLLQTPILGPPHANIRRPKLAFFVGTTTSKPEPLLYSAAVRSLAEHAGAGAPGGGGQHDQQHYQRSMSLVASNTSPLAPLVVNTDGWVKGMGEDLLGAVIDAVRPRHIVQILGTSTARTFDLDLNRLPKNCEVHRVEAWSPPPLVGGTPNPSRPSPQDQRTLRLVAYFLGDSEHGQGDGDAAGVGGVASNGCPGRKVVNSKAAVEQKQRRAKRLDQSAAACPDTTRRLGESIAVGMGRDGGGGGLKSARVRDGKVYDQEHEVAAVIAARKPRRVPWRAVQIRVMNGSVPPNLILHSINGALVGLVAMPKYRVERGGGVSGSGVEPPAGEGLVCLAETPLAPCVGLGIVRSIDVEKRVLYVLTPEPAEVLKDVNVLVMGSLQLPMVMLYDPNLCAHPYFSSEAVGGGVIKSRNNLMRRGVR